MSEPKLETIPLDTTPVTSWLDDDCARCPECGWSDFPHLAKGGKCPDCGALVDFPQEG